MLTGKFIGQNGSMGFKYGTTYKFQTYCEDKCICIKTSNGLWCPYENLEKLLENWIIYEVNKKMNIDQIKEKVASVNERVVREEV